MLPVKIDSFLRQVVAGDTFPNPNLYPKEAAHPGQQRKKAIISKLFL
jgi:hypothetical protein